MGGCGEGDVAVPADPGAAFEVVEAEGGVEFAVVVLDAPAACGQADQLGTWCVGGQVGQPVVAGFVLAGRPLHEQPAFGQDTVIAAVWSASDHSAGGTHPQGEEVPGQFTDGPVRVAVGCG